MVVIHVIIILSWVISEEYGNSARLVDGCGDVLNQWRLKTSIITRLIDRQIHRGESFRKCPMRVQVSSTVPVH